MNVGSQATGDAIQLIDADGDTKVTVEASPDEDIIRLQVAGTERVVLDDSPSGGLGHLAITGDVSLTGGLRVGAAASFGSPRQVIASIRETLTGITGDGAILDLLGTLAGGAGTTMQGLKVKMTDQSTAGTSGTRAGAWEHVYDNAFTSTFGSNQRYELDVKQGKITNYSYLKIQNPIGAGVIDTLVGLDVPNLTKGAVDNFAIRTQGGDVVLNESGTTSIVRMEGDTDTDLFKLDAINDRIGISEPSPTELFHIAGNLRTTGVSKHADGSANDPSMTFDSDTDLGWFRSLGNIMSLSANGSHLMRMFPFAAFIMNSIDTPTIIQPARLTNGVGPDINQMGGAGLGGTNAGGDSFVTAGAAVGGGTNGVAALRNSALANRVEVDSAGVGFQGAEPIAVPPTYTITNGTIDRTYDANTVGVAELADIVFTMITDIKNYGLLALA